MSALNALRTVASAVGALPVIRPLRERAYRRRFLNNRNQNLFMGVYARFEDAAAAAPSGGRVGYDNQESAELYTPEIYPYDYPALFWLQRSFDEGLRTVFDLGGHVGIKYYAFRRHLRLPVGLQWMVCDVPAVVARGRALAEGRGLGEELRFTTSMSDASGFDVLYASGSLQYLPRRLGELLADLESLPRRIVLNITAVHPTTTYYTLNSIGTAFCPYRVQARDELLDEVSSFGYVKRDAWENPAKLLVLPFRRGLSLDHYSGFCFDRLPAASGRDAL
ncbi:TIGR04325 family methyltransferase [Caldimonas brevitalea]|uniref:Methyltransferase, TIGR04325 family n=1 Tax=Caldimonas brevitalea TaxID=413882 RepID=A0A0G3BW24_9BURK|nr:TIGR04325 family methyltransferase [Caldimonas brevitalea]AKJ30730.1 hypothetical protein AAW51_4039 [Caldimonas brevitalea]